MFKRIVSFGCSLIYGDELPDWKDSYPNGEYNRGSPSQYVWPQIVANHFNIPHINKGFSGASNNFILRELIRYLFNTSLTYDWSVAPPKNFTIPYQDGDLVIVQWTSHERTEMYNALRDSPPGINYNYYDQIQAGAMKSFESRFKPIYEGLMTIPDGQAKTEAFLNNLIIAQSMLYIKSVPFFQCFGISEPLYENSMIELRSLVQSHIYDEFEHFMRFANIFNYDMGPNNHPLQQAHAEYAKHVIQYIINRLVT